MRSKGQSSVELLVTIGVALLMFLITISLVYTMLNSSTRDSEIRRASVSVSSLVSSIKAVYYTPGSNIYLETSLPDSLETFTIQSFGPNSESTLVKAKLSDGNEIIEYVAAKVSYNGDITSGGNYLFNISNSNGTVVVDVITRG
ncbi:MAG: hypothetical protein QW035_03995 [Candidatus Anstonellales archaeon]